MNRDVLLLNASEEVISVINWKKAITLLHQGKARKPYNYNKTHSVRTVKGDYNLPAAIVLVRYVYIPMNRDTAAPTRRNIFKRDKHTCQYCGFVSKNPKKLTLDHVHPRSKGGGTQWTNLVTACPTCNSNKGSKTLKECDMQLINKPKKPTWMKLHITGYDETGNELWSRWIDI